MKKSIIALSAISLIAFLAAAAPAGAVTAPEAQISAPRAVRSPQTLRYEVIVPARVARVAFFVDGRRRWSATLKSHGHTYDRLGSLRTGNLATGRHSLKLAAWIGHHLTVARRAFVVTPKGSGSRRSDVASRRPVAGLPQAPSEDGEATPRSERKRAPGTGTAAPGPDGAIPAGSILFGGHFDGSFGNWYVQSLPGRATINGSSPFSGSGNARFEVRPGDVEPDTGSNRSEVSGPTYDAGDDIYVRDEIRVPAGYSYQGPWQLIQQLHETNWGRSPGTATFLDASRRLSFRRGDSNAVYWNGPQLATGRWYDLVYRVKLSKDPSVGFVEVWLDGVQQILTNGSARMYGETIQTDQTYLKAGIYRDPTSTGISIVEHDEIAVGTSLAAVEAF